MEVLAALVLLSLTLFTLVSGIAGVIALGKFRQQESAVGAAERTIAESLNAITGTPGSTACTNGNAGTLVSALQAFNGSPSAVASGVSVVLSPTPTVIGGSLNTSTGALSFPAANDCSAGTAPGTDTGTLQVNFTVVASGVDANGGAVANEYSQRVTLVVGSPRV